MTLAPRWSEVTAIFGSRMDPPHLGHREAVAGLFRNPGVKQVLVIPSATPPHKPAQTSAQHRLQLARLNFADTIRDRIPGPIAIDDLELKRALREPQRPSYSFDTLQELKALHSPLAFVLGADQFQFLHTWYRFPEILKHCHWIALERKPNGTEAILKTLAQWSSSGLVEPLGSRSWKIRGSTNIIQIVPTEAREISSSQIRQEISKQGSLPPDLLLPEVEAYLKLHQLYGIDRPHDSTKTTK